MKKKIATMMFVLGLCVSTVLGGCGKKDADSSAESANTESGDSAFTRRWVNLFESKYIFL